MEMMMNMRIGGFREFRDVYKRQLQDTDTFNEDLLITTEPIFNNSIRIIRISNLVTEENIQTISGVLHDLIKNNIAPKNQENDLAKIRNQISHTVQLYIEDEKKCQDAILEISEVVLNVLHQNMRREYYFKEETLSLSQLCLSQLMLSLIHICLKEQDVDKEKLSRAPVRDNMNVIRKWRKNTWLVLQV